MTTMFNATLQLAERLKVLRTSTATGGSTTTIVDTKRTEGVDRFNGGTAWIITDEGGASAAPEGEWARVSDWNITTHTATIGAVTEAVAAGDTYGIAGGTFSLDMLIGGINDQLVKHKVVRYDTTSLDFVANQSEYDLPAGIRKDNLLNVYESTNDDADDNRWTPVNFRVETDVAGSTHTLVVDSRSVTTDNDIMLEYRTFLSPLYLATSVIDDSLPMARILDDAAASVLALSMRTTGTNNKLDIALMNMFREDAKLARAENPIRHPSKRGNINEAAGD